MGLIRDMLARRKGADPNDPAGRARLDVDAFCEASLMHAATPPVGMPAHRYGFFLYFAGAIRYAARQHGLDERAIARVTVDVIEKLGGAPAGAHAILEDIAYGSFKPPGASALEEGAATFRDWALGQDNSAPMRLAQLLTEW